MKHLSISEIAWAAEEERAAADMLVGLDVRRVELAPARSFGNVMTATEDSVRKRADELRSLGLEPRSFQALLFGQDGLFLFDGAEARKRMGEVLKACGRVAGWAGVGPMVFGSPKNRLRGDLSVKEANKIAAEFFREVGDYCAEHGSILVMEANPEQYGADYCTRLDQAAELVAMVDSPGFKLHVDAGGLALSGEDFETVLRESMELVAHVHASQAMLADFSDPAAVHTTIAKVLNDCGYEGDVAIEMRSQDSGLVAVEEAVAAVRNIYGL